MELLMICNLASNNDILSSFNFRSTRMICWIAIEFAKCVNKVPHINCLFSSDCTSEQTQRVCRVCRSPLYVNLTERNSTFGGGVSTSSMNISCTVNAFHLWVLLRNPRSSHSVYIDQFVYCIHLRLLFIRFGLSQGRP
jgi:hypothetical protein